MGVLPFKPGQRFKILDKNSKFKEEIGTAVGYDHKLDQVHLRIDLEGGPLQVWEKISQLEPVE